MMSLPQKRKLESFTIKVILRYILLSFFCITAPVVVSDSIHNIEVNGSFKHLYIGDRLLYKADLEREAGYESIAASLRLDGAQWGVLTSDTFTSDLDGLHWFALRVSNSSTKEIELMVNYDHAWLWDFTIYLLDDRNNLLKSYNSGHKYPFSSRPVPTRTFNLPIVLSPNQSHLILIKAEGRLKQVYAHLNLYEKETFFHSFEVGERAMWIYYGAMMVMALYNIVLYFTIKETIYLSFSWFVFSISAMYFSLDGRGFEIIWPDSPWIQERAATIFSLLTILTIMHFYKQFLRVRVTLPKFYILCNVLQIFAVLLIVYVSFTPPREDLRLINTLYMLSAVFYTFSFSNSLYLQFWKKMREAKHYNLSFGVFCVMAMLYVLQEGGVVDKNVVTLYGVYIGQLMMVVILSLSLADRINALKNAQQYAEAESYAKSEILAKMSHEIRTPMNGVLGMSELLSTTRLSEKQRDYNDAIYASGSTLLTIINDILDFSKIEAGKMELDHGVFNLEKRALETLEMFRVKALEKNIELLLIYDDESAKEFSGDPVRIQQIIINYLSNALKFTETGEVVLRIFSVADKRMRIEVVDTGIGIEEENIEKLFQAFNQADTWITKNYGGTGLGLAICKQLAELMDGEVGVETVFGEGSLFYAEIEVSPVESQKIGCQAAQNLLRGKRILIVDDNRYYAEALLRAVEKWGMRGDVTISGASAMDKLSEANRNERYDFVSVDCHMPAMDGKMFAEVMQSDSRWKDIPLVLLVATREEINSENEESNSTVLSVIKPLQVEALYSLYCELLGFISVEKDLINDQAQSDKEIFLSAKINILIAEDNPVNQQVLCSMLKYLGVICEVAPDGKEAVLKYSEMLDDRKNPFDVILMDCEMPGMNGFDATKKIRKIEEEKGIDAVDIYALTAHAVKAYVDRCYEVGMNGCIAKPIKIETLKNICNKSIDKNNSAQ